VLVVEAALRSGSLITARQALDQGREVFAIPGSIHNPLVKGCHALIRQGAKLVETATDILEELGALAAFVGDGSEPSATAPPPTSEVLDEDYRQLLTAMGDGPLAIDSLVERCGLTAEVVSSMLLILELEGYVAAVPGGLYCRLKA
jgi:DNA processing protein